MTPEPSRPLVLIGAGKMGGALLDGWLAHGMAPEAIVVVDPGFDAGRRAELSQRGVVVADAPPPDQRAGVLMLAIKPQMMDAVLPTLAPLRDDTTLVVSIAAGTTIGRIEAALGPGPLVRAMPNTPAQIGMGTTVCVANAAAGEAARRTATELLSTVGTVDWLEEEGGMDAVTALSGSGPAYVFLLAECLAAAGRAEGLPVDLAAKLARGTVAGAGALLARSELDPGTLRENVTSPGGTTAAALERLMADDGLERLITEAVHRAAERSRALGG